MATPSRSRLGRFRRRAPRHTADVTTIKRPAARLPRRVPQASPDAGTAGTVTPAVWVASEWTWLLLVIAAGLYGLTRLLAGFPDIVVPLLVAMLLAALLHPLVELLSRHRVPRPLATLAAMLLTLLVIAGLLILVGQQTAGGFSSLRTQAVAGINDLQTRLAGSPLHLSTTALSDLATRAQTAAKNNQAALLSGAVGVASTAALVLQGLFITLFATFFFLSSGQGIWAWLLRLLPAGAQRPLDEAGRSG